MSRPLPLFDHCLRNWKKLKGGLDEVILMRGILLDYVNR